MNHYIFPVNPKRNQPWIFTGRIDAETPILWPPDVKSRLIGKDLDAGKGWGQEESGWQRMRWLDSITDSMHMNLSELWEILKDRRAWRATVHGVGNAIQLSHPCSLLLLPSIFPSIRVFSNESALHIRWSKYWSFSISLSKEYSGLISVRIDWFDLIAVQGTLKSPQSWIESPWLV